MLVRVRNPEWDRKGVWFFDQPEYFEYSGEEVKVKWVGPDELALSTGDPEWPVRVIQRSRIISIDGQAPVVQTASKNPTRIVRGSRGEQYVVTGSTCTCAGFQFRKTCKHVRESV